MPTGYTGKILFVDLTSGVIKEQNLPEKIYRQFIGGTGLGIRVLYERMKPQTDPLGPDNMLGFVPGLLTGNPVQGCGRFLVVTKSPLTGTWTESNSGGTLGPELKAAGFDGVFFSGASPAPVYLVIKDGQANLADASHLWGKDTYETDDLLHQELGDDKFKISCIGPAGEKKSLLAGIVNEKGRIAGRGGVGAVMGSKNLKALAVKAGSASSGVSRSSANYPEGFMESRRKFTELIKANRLFKSLTKSGTSGGYAFLVKLGDSPLKNWGLSGMPAMPSAINLDGPNTDKYKVSDYTCYACPVRCGAILKQEEGPFAIPEEVHRPEYETLAGFGGMLLNDNLESVIKANDLCNRYGIDTIGTGGTIALAMECYEKGLINKDDTGGLDLTWGNTDAIAALVEQMCKREGFGAVLADGAGQAAARIGKGADQYAIAVRGKSLPYHDPRLSGPLGTAFIADANPAHHVDCHITERLEHGAKVGDDPALQVAPQPFEAFDKKGPIYALGFTYSSLVNAAGLCGLYTSKNAPPNVAELVAGVTGWDFGWEEALKAGRRILTLRQAFNAREGLTPDMFQLPKRIKEEPLAGPHANVKIDYAALKEGYLVAMGWDVKTGKPNQSTLAELDLTELTADLSA